MALPEDGGSRRSSGGRDPGPALEPMPAQRVPPQPRASSPPSSCGTALCRQDGWRVRRSERRRPHPNDRTLVVVLGVDLTELSHPRLYMNLLIRQVMSQCPFPSLKGRYLKLKFTAFSSLHIQQSAHGLAPRSL